MDVFDAAQKYMNTKTPVIILAGKEYGSGSSRDWAAKGPWMLVSRCYMSKTSLVVSLIGLAALYNVDKGS